MDKQPTRSGAVLIVDEKQQVTPASASASTSSTPLRPAIKKKKKKKKDDPPPPANAAAADKSVRFVLAGKDGSAQVIRFPGGVLRSVKIGKIPLYPMPLILGLMDTERFAPWTSLRRRHAWQALSSALAAVSGVLLALALAMLLVYLHLRPQIPQLMLTGFGMMLEVMPVTEERNGVYYAYSVDLVADLLVDYYNVNRRVDIHNEYMESRLFYRGTPLGKAYVQHFVASRDSHLNLLVTVQLVASLMELNVGYTLVKEMQLQKFEIVCELIVKARMSTVGRIMSPRFGVRARCFILLLGYDIASQECRNFNF